MKSILCYGDSLTFGSDPGTAPRHPFADRWPSALESGLGTDKARVIAEGLGGRTTVFDDWYAPADRNGARILPTLLDSHSPLDLVIIMLGTNDLKPFLGKFATEAGRGMVRLAQITKGFYATRDENCPEVMFLSPPQFLETENKDMHSHFGGGEAWAQSKLFAGEYKRRADEVGAHFFDAATVAVASPMDGVHLDAENTRKIGEALVPAVAKILNI